MNIDVARLETVLQNSLEAAGLASLLSLVIALVYRRFRRSANNASYVCSIAAAIAVILGIGAVIGGVGHSLAVGSLALRETEDYGPLVILRFTTGAMLLYFGVMNLALYRGIRAGRRWAIGVGVATGLLFWLYLVFTLPLPGTGGSVPLALGLWTANLLWLGAAVIASRQRKPDSTLPEPAIVPTR